MKYTIDTLTESFPKLLAGYSKTGPASCTPFITHVDGEPTLVITNGRAALALDIEAPPGTEQFDSVGKIFQGTTLTKVVSFSDLKEWASAHGWLLEYKKAHKEKCSECHGDGIIICNYDHEHDCDDCDGNGTIPIEEGWHEVDDDNFKSKHMLGVIANGMVIDRRQLATCLRLLDDDGMCEIRTSSPLSAIVIVGNGWKCAIMPFRSESLVDIDVFKG